MLGFLNRIFNMVTHIPSGHMRKLMENSVGQAALSAASVMQTGYNTASKFLEESESLFKFQSLKQMSDPEIKKISSEFFLSVEGVIAKIQLKSDYVFRGAFFYDGRNQAILGRNNKDFYLLKSIPPIIRSKILNSSMIMVAECSGDEIHQAYKVDVIKVDEIPGEDTFQEDYQKYFEKLDQMYGKDRVNKFKQTALQMWRKFISE